METTQPTVSPPQETSAKRNPWLWIPSLYFSQGIPNVIVATMSVVLRAGVLERKTGGRPVAISVSAKHDAKPTGALDPASVKLTAQHPATRSKLLVQPTSLELAIASRSAGEAKVLIDQAKSWNL